MRIRRSERAVVAAALLALAVMGGFFLGRNTTAGPVRIITQSAVWETETQPVRGLEPEETGTPPSAGSQPPEETADVFPININTATAEELQALPGIGEARAKAIVAYREEHGPFIYVEDLRGVSGIGDGILANIMDYIIVGEQNNG